jgi:glycosyltransferase involved in cell wall biosynthesis
LKILIPFFDLSIFGRYERQFRAVRAEVDHVCILYLWGKPEKHWETGFEFIKYELPMEYLGSGIGKYLKFLRMFMGARYVPSFVPCDLDLVYSISGAWMNLYGLEIANWLEIPHVIRLRGIRAEVIKYTDRNFLTKTLLQRIHESCLRRATLVTMINSDMENYLKSIGVNYDQIGDIVYNGVHFEKYFIRDYPEKFTPLYAGRISKEKGSQFLLELIKKSPYTWKVTGDIQDLDFIPPANCHYLGRTHYEDMRDFYSSGNVVCIPSFTEGFPNIILESYANARAIIASPKAIPLKDVQLYGKICDHDIEEWLKALKEMETDFSHIGYRARLYSQGWTWKKHGVGIRKQLDKAIEVFKK